MHLIFSYYIPTSIHTLLCKLFKPKYNIVIFFFRVKQPKGQSMKNKNLLLPPPGLQKQPYTSDTAVTSLLGMVVVCCH